MSVPFNFTSPIYDLAAVAITDNDAKLLVIANIINAQIRDGSQQKGAGRVRLTDGTTVIISGADDKTPVWCYNP
jgi:hypothetical protein